MSKGAEPAWFWSMLVGCRPLGPNQPKGLQRVFFFGFLCAFLSFA